MCFAGKLLYRKEAGFPLLSGFAVQFYGYGRNHYEAAYHYFAPTVSLFQTTADRGPLRKHNRKIYPGYQPIYSLAGEREVTKECTSAWRDELLDQGYSPVTINAMIAALNKFVSFVGWEECRVKPLRLQKRFFRDGNRELTREEYVRLVQTARSTGRERLALLLEAVCATGIRVSEVKYLTVQAAKTGRAEIFLKGKVRVILIPKVLCRKLLTYARAQKTLPVKFFLPEAEGGCPGSRFGRR